MSFRLLTAASCLLLAGSVLTRPALAEPERVPPAEPGLLATEKLVGEGVWVDPQIAQAAAGRLPVKVWFDEQLLGDGGAYRRRAEEFAGQLRRPLREAATKTLKQLSERSFGAAKEQLDKLVEEGAISRLEQHWIVNGFSCIVTRENVDALKSVPGVKMIFLARRGGAAGGGRAAGGQAPTFQTERPPFDPDRFKHPWYIRYLQADRVWKELGVAGKGTLNVVHDFNFVFSDNVSGSLYRNGGETPGNGEDDDGNGLVDDYHGYDFDRSSPNLTRAKVPVGAFQPQQMHAFMCAAIICGTGQEGKPFEFGIAPQASWTGVIAAQRLEAAVEWAVEQGADTYSMSFSIPNLGQYRSHWRKLMEQGSLCGVYFVSGAGNFAQQQPVPVQMRTPEDIPDVVFAAAGVQRNFARTPFSSKGPVEWKTAHYQDGLVQKPEVCAFNSGLPALLQNGRAANSGLNGNSFAGPMFCGSIALMLSADPDLLPWDLKEIITSTATDVAAEGVDDETGHGLINCYAAVKEVLRRKAVREGKDAAPYEPDPSDSLDVAAVKKKLASKRLKVARVQPNRQAAKAGLQAGDVIVSYNGEKVGSPRALQQLHRRAVAAQLEQVVVGVMRGGKLVELKLTPGPLGLAVAVEFDEPTFQ